MHESAQGRVKDVEQVIYWYKQIIHEAESNQKFAVKEETGVKNGDRAGSFTKYYK
jgi:hypothetical protein